MATKRKKDVDLTELFRRASMAEPKAVGELIYNHLRSYFCGIIKKRTPAASDVAIEEILSAFQEYIHTPTQEGKYRMHGLDCDRNPMVYMGRMFDNFYVDYLNEQARRPKCFDDIRATSGDDGETVAAPAPGRKDEAEPDLQDCARRQDAEVWAFLKALEHAATFNAEDRYILFTYLLSERFVKTGRPLKLDTHIARQLNKNPHTVYNTYDRKIHSMRDVALRILKGKMEEDKDDYII